MSSGVCLCGHGAEDHEHLLNCSECFCFEFADAECELCGEIVAHDDLEAARVYEWRGTPIDFSLHTVMVAAQHKRCLEVLDE